MAALPMSWFLPQDLGTLGCQIHVATKRVQVHGFNGGSGVAKLGIERSCSCGIHFSMPVLRGIASPSHLHIHELVRRKDGHNLVVDLWVLLDGIQRQADPFITDGPHDHVFTVVRDWGHRNLHHHLWCVGQEGPHGQKLAKLLVALTPLWHSGTAAPHPWSSANWPGVPWPFLPDPCGNVGSSRASHTRCHTALSWSSCCHRRGTRQAESKSGSASASSAPHHRGPRNHHRSFVGLDAAQLPLASSRPPRCKGKGWSSNSSSQLGESGSRGLSAPPVSAAWPTWVDWSVHRPTSKRHQTGEVLQSDDCTSVWGVQAWRPGGLVQPSSHQDPVPSLVSPEARSTIWGQIAWCCWTAGSPSSPCTPWSPPHGQWPSHHPSQTQERRHSARMPIWLDPSKRTVALGSGGGRLPSSAHEPALPSSVPWLFRCWFEPAGYWPLGRPSSSSSSTLCSAPCPTVWAPWLPKPLCLPHSKPQSASPQGLSSVWLLPPPLPGQPLEVRWDHRVWQAAPGWKTFWPSFWSSSCLMCGRSLRLARASTRAGSGAFVTTWSFNLMRSDWGTWSAKEASLGSMLGEGDWARAEMSTMAASFSSWVTPSASQW